ATIKRLEIDALARALRAAGVEKSAILEAGSGNGWNCLALAEEFPEAAFTGFDYVVAMVESAREHAARLALENLRFEVADLFELDGAPELAKSWDAVFTDRCLINVLDGEQQKAAIAALAQLVRPGGTLILIENFVETYARQNDLRVLAGLPPRTAAPYNRFLD